MRGVRIAFDLLAVVVGVAVALFACAIPVYWVAVDKCVVAAAGAGGKSLADLAAFRLDSAQVSTALILARCATGMEEVEKEAQKAFSENPSWRYGGGDSPFFAAFCAAAGIKKNTGAPLFSYLASRSARDRLAEFLSQSNNRIVKKILSTRGLSTVNLPPAMSSAGASFDAAVLTLSLAAQSGDLGEEFLFELSSKMDALEDIKVQQEYELCAVGVLALARNLDASAVGAVLKLFKSPDDVFEFAKVYAGQVDAHAKDCVVAAALAVGDAPKCARYLRENAARGGAGAVSFALEYGEGSVEFLLENGKPLYENSPAAELFDGIFAPVKSAFSLACAENPKAFLVLKLLLTVLGFAVAISGALRMLRLGRASTFLGVRCVLAALICTAFASAVFEPAAFEVKIENADAAEFRIAFDKIKSNIVGEKDMFSLDTDSATLAAIALFFVMQSTVYVVCLIRIGIIRRTRASASLKLKLLENEDNLFDLGLYIGLAGTVASLILLTFGVITASLMAGYTSTLFGILFTALVKIVHLRKLKRKLLIEAANEQH